MREQDLIEYVRRAFSAPDPDVIVGIGDDAAVVNMHGDRAVATTDAMFEGVHFDLRWMTAAEVGGRAVEVNVSDLAAMGATPRFLLLALAARAPLDGELVTSVIDGFAERAKRRGCTVIGGNVTRASELSVTVTAIGGLDPSRKPLTRAGARPGDLLFVTGTLGCAALGHRLLAAGKALLPGAAPAIARWRLPEAQVDVGLNIGLFASAAIDVSDGLATDLQHVAVASNVGAIVDLDRVPTVQGHAELAAAVGAAPLDLVLAGGDDYELLFCASPQDREKAATLGCHEIGVITKERTVGFLGGGKPYRSPPEGFQHF